MADTTLYANYSSVYSGLLNGGEASWEESSTTSGRTTQRGTLYFNTLPIPSDSTINSAQLSFDFRQSRSVTAWYHSRSKATIYVDGTNIGTYTSGDTGDTFITMRYGLTGATAAVLAKEHGIRLDLADSYEGALKTTQYVRDVKISVSYTLPNRTISVVAGTGGTVSGGGTVTYGGSVNISATANSGYHFVSWNDGNTNPSRTISNITSNATYTATFQRTTVRISASSNIDQSISRCHVFTYLDDDDLQAKISEWLLGDIQLVTSLDVAVGEKYCVIFLPWNNVEHWMLETVNGEKQSSFVPIVSVANEGLNYYTEYKKSATLLASGANCTVTESDSGNIDPVGFFLGQTATVSVTPDPGYHFVGWYNEENTDNPRIVVFEEAKTYHLSAICRPDKINKIYVAADVPSDIYIGSENVNAVYVENAKVYG